MTKMWKYEKSFVIGSDQNQEKILLWWIQNFRRNVRQTPLVFLDFGISDFALQHVYSDVDLVVPFRTIENRKVWFNKPGAMKKSESRISCWMDIDTQILTDISDIFDHHVSGKLTIARDPVMIRQGQDKAMNSGIVVYDEETLPILDLWEQECINNHTVRGDQEALRELCLRDKTVDNSINILSQDYNWLRLMYMRGEDSLSKKVIHWTGPTGKDILLKKIIPKFDEKREEIMTKIGHDWKPEQ